MFLNSRTRLLVLGLVSAILGFVNSQEYIDDIECPFPEGQQGQDQAECAMYSACEWSGEQCHMRTKNDIGYKIDGQEVIKENGFYVNLLAVSDNMTLFGGDIPTLKLDVTYHSDVHLQIKITDANNERYEVPIPLNLPPTTNISSPNNYKVTFRGGPDDDLLVLKIVRSSDTTGNNNIIFRQTGPITFEDQFIQFTIWLASGDLYGFGENNHDTFKHQFDPRVTQSIFTRDQSTFTANVNSYGAHPYHMVLEDEFGNAHSIFMLNSNAMEYSTFMTQKRTKPALTCRTIGGVLDLHMFMGPTPEEVNQQYISVIGKPSLPPYYALGFHLSRWGYTGTDEISQIQTGMRNGMIPQDVQTFDIDYMDGRRDFTVNPSANWSTLPQLIADMKSTYNIYSTVILDPALSTEFSTYPPAQRGVDADVFIKWADESYVPTNQPEGAGDYVVGNVWPAAPTVFPDFLNAETQDWWIDEVGRLHNTLDFHNLWMDMNEPSNFDTNQPGKLNCPETPEDDPPYPTLAARGPDVVSPTLSDKTICMSSTHRINGTEFSHYDVHSLYGWSESMASYRAMLASRPGLRPVVLSRSTYPGSGQYAFHWLGDNFSTWEQMRKSIIGLFEFNMFGMPFVGADVCGFNGDTTEELCGRWTQLGAFYPFNRNHNSIGRIPQEPTQWPSVAAIARDYITLRYMYNPYLYLLLHFAAMHGETVVRPLFNVFPADIPSRAVEDQFLWGSALMIAPVLVEGATTRDVYFPPSIWYDLVSGEMTSMGSETLTVDAPFEVLPLYVRGGSILPWQEPATTTTTSRLNNFGFTVAIDENEFSTGEIFWDDGESLYTIAQQNSYRASVNYSMNNLTTSIRHGNEYMSNITLNTVKFYGYFEEISTATINGVEVGSYLNDVQTGVLQVFFDAPMSEEIVLTLVPALV